MRYLRRRAALFATIVSALALGLSLTSLAPLASPAVPALAVAVVQAAPTVLPVVRPTSTPQPIAAPVITPQPRWIEVEPTAQAVPTVTPQPAPKVTTAPKPATTKPKTTVASKPVTTSSYRGKNHFWFPALGINRSVDSRACTGSADSNGTISRWCGAGAGNTYLLAHAWGAFDPLEMAYWGHRLRVGQSVWYADASGRVRHYEITFWKVVSRTASNIGWVYAGSSTPEMTLQTCVDNNGNVLIVRLRLVP